MEYKTGSESEDSNIFIKTKRNKTSYVWTYFQTITLNGKEVNECVICNSLVGTQTSNLARHLITTHNISKPKSEEDKLVPKLKQSRSFVWKYSTKEDLNHARCHFCNKLLYCGGGNTSNLSKHLRRRHMDLIDDRPDSVNEREEDLEATTAIIQDGFIEEGVEGAEVTEIVEGCPDDSQLFTVYSEDDKDGKSITTLDNNSNSGKDRKGSYVWNYCDKLSRHTIRCKLCSKVMSFHGTANVITHLQRRHNIVSPMTPKEQAVIIENIKLNADSADEVNENTSRRRSMGNSSVVWNYCKRINRDTVRCIFCKKNLSYQGTSNLQRHLHRMHGIVTQGRAFKASPTKVENEAENLQLDIEILWEFLDEIENGDKVKCKMCDFIMDSKDGVTINKHLVSEHSVRPPQQNVKRPRLMKNNIKLELSDIENGDSESWNNYVDSENVDDLKFQKQDSFFDDIIEEDHEVPANFDEEELNSSVPITNPLSPQSIQSCTGDMSPDPRNGNFLPYMHVENPNLQKLHEERMRVETEYFKEKAAFFRMQKYFTALQAKKVRIELERLNSTQIEYTGPTYSVNVGIPQEELAILPAQ